jgi:hypothetical protein
MCCVVRREDARDDENVVEMPFRRSCAILRGRKHAW